MFGVTDLYDAAARCGLLATVKVGAVTVQAAFRAPDENVLDGLALSRDYQIEYPSERLTLSQGDAVEVAGQSYRVREVRQIRDGSESVATLVNVIDPGMAADYLNSAAGEKTILNVLSRNGSAVRELLR